MVSQKRVSCESLTYHLSQLRLARLRDSTMMLLPAADAACMLTTAERLLPFAILFFLQSSISNVRCQSLSVFDSM